ncbi:type I-E CRISPR-associated protein Cse1/CasA [Fontivita pretiosa]|uniref:type I-E CRISPR-associated protein Cse1/CasA n=1 Tax=Fontivita pretiosa TaxID=2989684 RepID=UPI003D16D95E
MTDSFNLVKDEWIPVLYCDGRFARVGMRTALSEAGKIRQIAASNPMDNVALLRFLLAVLLWCKGDLRDEDHKRLEGGDGIPDEWLKELDTHKEKFNLLGEGERFYQDRSLKGKEPRPVADLLVEFPGEDSVNHMRHVVHGTYGFCPACCALGILRLSVWAPANKYYPASVNPASAAYAVVQERNLLLTVLANLPAPPAQPEQAPWLIADPPASPGAVANLAWRPRKLWLDVAPDPGPCANCGVASVLVSGVCTERGWPTPTTAGRVKKYWADDPHLLKDGEPISLPGLGASAAAHASALWRHGLRLRGAAAGKVIAIGPVVNKFSFQDATSVYVPNACAQARATLTDDCRNKLRDLRKQITPNPDRQHPEIQVALILMTPDMESRILAALKNPNPTTDDGTFLTETYQPLVDQVVASTVCGSPLRRRAAMSAGQALLDKTIRQLVDKANPSSTPAGGTAPAKPERGGRKQGGGA